MRSLLILVTAVWLSGCSALGTSLDRPSALKMKEVPGAPGIDLTTLLYGDALPGAMVTVSNAESVREYITDVNGRILVDLEPGSWRIEVTLEGLRPAAGQMLLPRDTRIEAIADLTVDMSCAIIIACPLAPGELHLPAQHTFYNHGYAWALPAP